MAAIQINFDFGTERKFFTAFKRISFTSAIFSFEKAAKVLLVALTLVTFLIMNCAVLQKHLIIWSKTSPLEIHHKNKVKLSDKGYFRVIGLVLPDVLHLLFNKGMVLYL